MHALEDNIGKDWVSGGYCRRGFNGGDKLG